MGSPKRAIHMAKDDLEKRLVMAVATMECFILTYTNFLI